MTNGEDMVHEGAPVGPDDSNLMDGIPDGPVGEPGYTEPTAEDLAAMEQATIDIPKFVCIIGAAGAGKSALAEAIAEELGDDTKVVDNYAQDLAKDMDIALGFYASYVPNLMVAMEREKADHKARKDMDAPVVVVGSLIETLTYAGLKAEYLSMQITTPEQQASLNKEMLGMNFIGVMLQDLMKFHHYFWVKLPPEIIIEGQDPKFDNATRAFERAMSQIVAQLGVPVHEVSGSVDKQMETVRETLGLGSLT